MQSLSSTLDTQDGAAPPTGLSRAAAADTAVAPANNPAQVTSSEVASAPPTVSVKRGPGRPKGSGAKKPVDPNAPITPKRPVGRPRKDGLPAGSVPRAPLSSTTRKRRVAAPGSFAATISDDGAGPSQPTTPASAPGYPASTAPLPYANFTYPTASTPQLPWQTTSYSTLSAALQQGPPAQVASAPVAKATPDVSNSKSILEHDEWVDLLRTDPNALLQSVVHELRTSTPVSRVGLSVEAAFKYHLNTLAPNPGPSTASVYAVLKTFWLPSSPAYFSLTASSSVTQTPPEHRFFYWDPQPLVFNGIACPYCSIPLANKGCIRSGPVKVYDLGKPFYIIGGEYMCQNASCKGRNAPDGRRFASTDPSIMRSLPQILRDEFPVMMLPGASEQTLEWNWQEVGVSKTLWAIVLGCLNGGMGKQTTLALIRSARDGVLVQSPYKQEDEGHDEKVVEQALQQSDEMLMSGAIPENAVADAPFNDEVWKSAAAPSNAPEQAAADTSSASVLPPSTSTPTSASMTFGYPQSTPYTSYQYGPYPYFYQQPEPTNGASSSSLKRGGEVLATEPPTKRIRHCVKCGSKDCKGKGGRNFCSNPCQDCGQMGCKGRNSKRPDKTCVDAWPGE